MSQQKGSNSNVGQPNYFNGTKRNNGTKTNTFFFFKFSKTVLQ